MSGPKQVSEQAVPGLPRGVRLKHDQERGQWVILAPERVFVLDDVAREIVRSIDGQANIGAIIDGLAERFAAPRDVIAKDVLALLEDLLGKGVIET